MFILERIYVCSFVIVDFEYNFLEEKYGNRFINKILIKKEYILFLMCELRIVIVKVVVLLNFVFLRRFLRLFINVLIFVEELF